MSAQPPADAVTLAEASDPTTSPGRLRALAVHPDHRVQRAVATNASTPRDLVLALLETYPFEAAANPTLPFWLLERPDLLHQRPKVVPALLTVEPPPWLVSALEAHWNPRSAARADILLGRWLARRPGTPSALLGLLCAAGHAGTRALAARHPDVPYVVKAQLRAVGSSDDLREVVRRRPAVTVAQLRAAMRLGVWGAELVASHPRTPPGLIDELVADGLPSVLLEIARRRQLPVAVFTALVEHPLAAVRQAALDNPDMPRRLARDRSP